MVIQRQCPFVLVRCELAMDYGAAPSCQIASQLETSRANDNVWIQLDDGLDSMH